MRIINFEERYVIILLKAVLEQTPVKNTQKRINWEKVLRISDFQNIVNIVHYGMLGIEKNVSEEYIDDFYQKYKRELLLKQAYKEAEQTVKWQLDRHGIHALILAGHGEYNYYPKEELAHAERVEILIEKKDLHTVQDMMKEMDYEEQQERLDNGHVFVRTPGIQIAFYESVPIGNDTLEKYFSKSVRKYKKASEYKYIHLLDVEEEYLYRIGRLVEKYMQGELKIRHFLDFWLYENAHSDREADVSTAKLLEKAKLTEFALQAENLADLWFGNKGVPEGGEVFALEGYVLSGGREDKWLDGRLLPFEKVRLDFYKRNREEEWEGRVRSWWFPSKDYMTRLFPILKKFPFLLWFFWLKRGMRLLTNMYKEYMKKKWSEIKEKLPKKKPKEEEENIDNEVQ